MTDIGLDIGLDATAKSFAEQFVVPQAAQWERERRLPFATLRAAADAGLTGLIVPIALGGRQLSNTAMAKVMERLAAADMSFAFSLVVHNNLMGSIARWGSQEQHDRYLQPLAAMDMLGAFLLTEPRGGSDAAAIATMARRDGSDWIIDGEKAWITNATHANLLSVYAQTDMERGARGIAAFLVDADQDGVYREEPYDMLGGHALGAGGFRFEGCRVKAADVLVPPGEGFKAALSGIDVARANVAAMCSGMLGSSLEIAVDYASKRLAFGARIADFQGLQWQLADVATDLHAMRLMAYTATDRIDAVGSAPVEAAHAKKFATSKTLGGIATCMQVLGANGLKHEFPLPRFLASAKIAEYLDGTTEIQNVVISRSLFGVGTAR